MHDAQRWSILIAHEYPAAPTLFVECENEGCSRLGIVLDLRAALALSAGMRSFLLPAVFPCLMLVSCVDPKPTSGSEVRETGGDLAEAKVPVLRSAYLEKSWGLPQITTFSDGSYRMRFRQGDTLNFVFIHGLVNPSAAPSQAPDIEEYGPIDGPVTLTKQSWRSAVILGSSVKWYQHDTGGGADFPCYKTVDFALTAPDGRKGHYRIEVCADSETKAAQWIRKVNW